MTENTPSPYEQGFRDALLTARSLLLMTQDLDIAIRGLDQQIDDKNHDLWNLLALAKVPEAPDLLMLRQLLRSPRGALIDGQGRMLFLRLPGAQPGSYVEYDTGVTTLLTRLHKIETELAQTKKEST